MAESTSNTSNLSTVYNPAGVEQRIYAFWEQGGYFTAGRDKRKPPFSIVLPPPNVTGNLHLGHAWDNTLQDIIIRFKRMNGFDALWLPGTDHAGIATQTRVEKHLLADEGKSRHDLGREAFVERVWAWKNEYGNTITQQIRAIGGSCDWSRERFTMDEGLSKAVRTVFVRLYEKGLIYRGNRIINWCPRCSTALSDIEVEHSDVNGVLYHIQYPFVSGEGGVTVATTRPETLFGDVAVAVHPGDARYAAHVGAEVKLPLTDRTIPVIADEYVDPEYGTGCVKITPAHDPNDYEVGLRHNLPQPQCIDADGRMNGLSGQFAGLSREDARRSVVEQLQKEGFLVSEEPISHAVGHCSRCSTVVEPFLSLQWFVHMKPLSDAALEAVQQKQLRFVPERFERIFVQWLENVRDWCISRQLWWGHRIPAWYCQSCGHVSVHIDEVTTCSQCNSTDLRQDEDVLDTWFSSALWPFSTMGWPDQTEDLSRYYPTSTLVTGYDIIFFWVARMVFMGLEFTGKMPFQEVVLHGLIRAADGRKMSKSLGNGVDPIEVIEKYGADALRFTIANGTSPGNDQRFSWEKVESSRNFINKVWNASRFVLMNLESDKPSSETTEPQSIGIAERWILTRLSETVERTTQHLNRYDFGEAGRAIYDFAWDDFCDWYIEFSKLALYGDDARLRQSVQSVLVTVLDGLLRMLHPFIPFVTEEIWHALPYSGETLTLADWPNADAIVRDADAVRQMERVMEVIRGVRNVRAERNVPPGKPIQMLVHCQDETTQHILTATQAYLKRFCGAEEVEVQPAMDAPDLAVAVVVTGATIYLPLASLVNLDEERDRLAKERDRLIGEVERVEKKLNNAQFIAKAPDDVVAGERAKKEDYQQKLAAVLDRIEALQKG